MVNTLMSDSVLSFLADAAMKGTILLLLAFVADAAWRGASAAGKHLLWILTISGLMAAPILASFAPIWRFPAMGPKSLEMARLVPGNVPAEIEVAVKAEVPAPKETSRAHASPVLVAIQGATPPSAFPTDTMPNELSLIPDLVRGEAWIIATWLVGVGLSAIWLVGGWLSLGRLARNCRSIQNGPLYKMLIQVSAGLGIRRPVRLLLSHTRTIPMTWGVVRPVVLLPHEAQTWSADRLRMVLVHELGHVQRWDCLTQMVAHVGRGLYWFHPLAWLAVRRLRTEQEQACDDLVLQTGVNGPDYAEQLLAVTTGLSANLWTAPVALGIGRAEKLNHRLVSLLDAKRNHQPMSRRKLVIAAALALALFLPLATAGLTPYSSAQEVLQEQKEVPKSPSAKESASAKRVLEVQQKLAQHYVVPVDEKTLSEHAVKGLLQALKDPYTTYLTAEEMARLETEIKGALTGIGAQLQMTDQRLTVTTPLEGSPALKAGVRPGDRIEAIAGQSTQGISLADAVQRILGPAGSKVTLKVVHVDGEVEDMTVTRAELRLGTIKGFRRGAADQWEYLLDSDHKIGYLHINQFGSRTAAEVREALLSLQKDGMKGLILDLRFCPGGLLDQALEVCKLFLQNGVILSIRGPGNEEKSWKADGKQFLGDFPLLVLINDQTASAGEIVAGSLHDNGRAVLLGTRSFGKGSVQSIVKLDEGGALKITTSNHYLPSGRNIQKRPGEKSWGVDPSDGFYIPLSAMQTAALLKDAKSRSVLGLKPQERPALTRLSPPILEEKHADPQLAGALQTMVARLTGGEFIKVGKARALQEDHAVRLEELRQRRELLQQDLQQLDRNINVLQQAANKEKAGR